MGVNKRCGSPGPAPTEESLHAISQSSAPARRLPPGRRQCPHLRHTAGARRWSPCVDRPGQVRRGQQVGVRLRAAILGG